MERDESGRIQEASEYCRNCGEIVRREFSYCGQCGVARDPVNAALNSCIRCRVQIPDRGRRCYSCGARQYTARQRVAIDVALQLGKSVGALFLSGILLVVVGMFLISFLPTDQEKRAEFENSYVVRDGVAYRRKGYPIKVGIFSSSARVALTDVAREACRFAKLRPDVGRIAISMTIDKAGIEDRYGNSATEDLPGPQVQFEGEVLADARRFVDCERFPLDAEVSSYLNKYIEALRDRQPSLFGDASLFEIH